MTVDDRIRRQVHDYVVANMLFGVGDVADDTSLLGEGILDSMGVLETVLFIEEAFHVEVSDDEVVPNHFDSVHSLTAFIANKLPVQRLDSAC